MNDTNIDIRDWPEADIKIYNNIVEQEQEVLSAAKRIVDNYWVRLDKTNRTIMDNKRTGQNINQKTGVVAPVVETVKTGNRITGRLIWGVFAATGFQKKNRRTWKRIPFSKGAYEHTYMPNAILKNSVGWDAPYILAAEAELEPLRLMLKNYQRMIVSMTARNRRVIKLTEKRANLWRINQLSDASRN